MSQKIGKTGLAFARLWHHVDAAAETRTLGRLALAIAVTLMGKHKPVFHKLQDLGDYVVVLNCQHLRILGNLMTDKKYYLHRGRPGHLKVVTMGQMVENKGYLEVLRRAVKNMLPRNKLRTQRLARLKVFDGSEHPYKQNLVAHADEQPLVQQLLEQQKEQQRLDQEEAAAKP